LSSKHPLNEVFRSKLWHLRRTHDRDEGEDVEEERLNNLSVAQGWSRFALLPPVLM
jgi:hypothetical protein